MMLRLSLPVGRGANFEAENPATRQPPRESSGAQNRPVSDLSFSTMTANLLRHLFPSGSTSAALEQWPDG
jgi:hypothetical protein